MKQRSTMNQPGNYVAWKLVWSGLPKCGHPHTHTPPPTITSQWGQARLGCFGTVAATLLNAQWGQHKEPYSAVMQYSWWGVSGAVKHSRVVRRPSNPLSGSSCCLGRPTPLSKADPLARALSLSFAALPWFPSLLPLTQPLIFNHNLNGCLGCGCGGSKSRALASGYKVGNKFEEIKLNIEGGRGLTREKMYREEKISTCCCHYSLIRISTLSSWTFHCDCYRKLRSN